MSTAVSAGRVPLDSAAGAALQGAAWIWSLVAVVGQWAFLYYIVAFYGPPTLTGNFQGWSKNTFLFKGYVAGDTAGNLVFAAHALLAAVIAFGGALQLVPQIRARTLSLHRWNGRVFLLTAMAVSLSGLYMVWVRGNGRALTGRLAISLNAALIIAFAVLAWRSALRRDVAGHRRWALRAYLVANAQWFIRVGVIAWIMVHQALGVKKGFDDPFILFADFACYLLPLAVLELYLHAQDKGGPLGRIAVAGVLLGLTALMAVGIFGFAMFTRPLLAKL